MSEKQNPNVGTNVFEELINIKQRLSPGGDFGPAEDRKAWDKHVESKPPARQEVLRELTTFFDLLRYMESQNEKMDAEVLAEFEQLRDLPVERRAERLRQINQQFMQRFKDEGQGAQFRQ